MNQNLESDMMDFQTADDYKICRRFTDLAMLKLTSKL